MENALYADLLFLINFGMDLISIWLTLMIVHRKTSGVRLAAASALGGAYGVASVLIGAEGVLSFLFGFAVSFLMILISCKTLPGMWKLLEYTVILWGVGALCGGIITALCSLGNGDIYGFRTHNAPFFIFALGVLAAGTVVKLISRFRNVKSCSLSLTAFGERYTASALVDSGNIVKEPMSGLPVIFLSSKVFSKTTCKDIKLLSEGYAHAQLLSEDAKRRIRFIGIRGVSSEKLMTAFMPDEVSLIIKNRADSVRAYVVIDPELRVDGYDGIVPAALIS
ncbi:MAG: sigma-E processing peptidase SpoIIGA [Clostridia bacterium]|nr:sigma-E processing peptidase SpoIIGA [Clostridia bacterium]